MKSPKIHSEAKVAQTALIAGDVTLEKGANVWYHAVIRGDLEPIVIGENSNVQDGCVLHVSHDAPLTIGKGVTIGHAAIVHGCTVGDNSLIGMGSTIMDHAVIGRDCIVAAGSLVIGGTVVPDGSLVMGSPAKVKRATTPEDIEANRQTALHYVSNSSENL